MWVPSEVEFASMKKLLKFEMESSVLSVWFPDKNIKFSVFDFNQVLEF